MKTALEIICNGAAERHCQILLIGGYGPAGIFNRLEKYQ